MLQFNETRSNQHHRSIIFVDGTQNPLSLSLYTYSFYINILNINTQTYTHARNKLKFK